MKIEKTVDRGSKEKLYVQVYTIFLKKIESGEWADGSQIPSEDELCRIYHVSKVTVREAIQELVREGYLRRQQGRGTFVTHTMPHAGILMRVWLSERDLFGEEVNVRKEIVKREVRESSDEIKRVLMTEDDIHYILSRVVVDDEPFAEEFFMPLSIIPDLQAEKLTGRSMYDLIEERGAKKIFRISQTAEIAAIRDDVAKVIGMREGTAALFLRRIMQSVEGIPVAYSRLIGSGRKRPLRMEFERLK